MQTTKTHQLAVVLTLLFVACTRPALAGKTCEQWTTSPFVDQPEGINNWVAAMTIWTAPGGAQLLVVGGFFTTAGGVPANHIAAWDGASWRSLGAGLDGPVYCLTVYNGELIAGGTFSSSAGTAMSRIARWNGQQWQPLGLGLQNTNLPPSAYLQCMTLAVFNGELIAGGSFSNAGSVAANNIARWNGTTWNSLATVNGQGMDWTGPGEAQVRGLTVLNNMLYVGGFFNLAGGTLAANVARWSGSAWSPLGVGVNGYVHELSQFNGELVAGGDFTTAGGAPANSVARWNTASNTWGTFGAGINQAPYAFQNFNGGLLAGGYPFGGGTLMFWNGVNWSAWNGGVSGTEPWIDALAVYNGELIAGGSFNHAGGSPGMIATNIAKFDGTLWQTIQAYPGDLVAMTTLGSRVIVGGLFTQSCGTGGPANNIASWNGTSLSRFGAGTNNPVLALKGFTTPGPFGGDLVVAGGFFTAVDGIAANHIAIWNPQDLLNSWSAMGAGLDGSVLAIERHSNVIYAGGSFTMSGGSGVSRIARWTGTTWQPLGSGCNGNVYAMLSYNGLLYVGGNFTSAGGVSTGGLARWNATTSSWSNVGGFFNGIVNCLTIHNGELVIGGLYPGINNSPNIAKYNGSSYSTPGTGGTNGQVFSLTSSGGTLYLGGSFTTAGGLSASRLARWNASTGWSTVQGGVGSTVTALTSLNGEVHAGGNFSAAGTPAVASPGWARHLVTGAAWIVQQPASSTVDCDANATFTVDVAVGYNPVNRYWHRNGDLLSDGVTAWGSTINGVNAKTLTIGNARAQDAGAYHCLLFNACGSATSSAANLTVRECCDGDLNHSGVVNIDDLVGLITSWGACSGCPADIAPPSGNGIVDFDDLVSLIITWGTCP